MEKIKKLIARYLPVVILALSIPAVWALFVPGYYGASDDLHIAWLFEMDRTLALGQFPPRFVPDLSYSFGYPLFNFVFPFPFYIGELLHKLGLSFVDSIKGVFLLSVPVSMYFMYKFLKEHANEILALAGAIVYVYTPYRATDIYVRGAVGEALAFVFPPLVAWALSKIASEKKKKWIGVLGLGIAGLVLSHNIMAYMFVPFLAIYAFMLRKNLVRMFLGLILGISVSIYFWLPAIVESSVMKYGTGEFNFIDHFPTIRQLFTPYFGYGASVPGPGDGMSFFLGVINILLLVSALLLIRKAKKIILWALLVMGVSIFLMNHRSAFLWDNVPYLPYFQFPWRFLGLSAFVTSVLVIVFDKVKFGKFVGIAIIILAIGLNFSYFRPHDFLGRTDSYYLNKYIPFPVASEEYKMVQEEYLRLPKSTQFRPDKTSPDTGLDASFNLNLTEDSVFHYYKYYYPGWKAKVDGREVEIKPGSPYGQITFDVPKGEHNVEVNFEETQVRRLLNYVSLFSLIVALYLLI